MLLQLRHPPLIPALLFFFFQAEDGIRDSSVTGVQTCALPISGARRVRERALVAHPLSRGVRLTGPAPAPFERLRGEWRFQLLARAAAFRDLHRDRKSVV